MIAKLGRYVQYLQPHHEDDHHHDGQHDGVHDTPYLAPSQDKPPYVPRYDGTLTTTTTRSVVPQYQDYYGK